MLRPAEAAPITEASDRVLSLVGLYLYHLDHPAWPEGGVDDFDSLLIDWMEATPEEHKQAHSILTIVYEILPEHLIWH